MSRNYTFSYGCVEKNQMVDVTDIMYENHVKNGVVVFSASANLDEYFGDPAHGEVKRLVVHDASSGAFVCDHWQRAAIAISRC